MQHYSLSFYSFSHSSNVVGDRLDKCTWWQKTWNWILPKNKWKSIADIHIDTAYEKYRRHLCQYSKSLADTIGSNINTAILTTLLTNGIKLSVWARQHFYCKFYEVPQQLLWQCHFKPKRNGSSSSISMSLNTVEVQLSAHKTVFCPTSNKTDH